jgi:predicted AAA+ superfamily ATPase
MIEEDIYTTVPENICSRQSNSIDRRRILEFLRNNTGKFFTAKEIAKEYGGNRK